MTKPQPPGMTEFPVTNVPPSAQSITLAVRIMPRSGALSIYASPNDSRPVIQCKGNGQVTIGYGGGPLYIQKLPGTVEFEIKIVSWT